ncbi:uncharacterized protein C15orf39 homolog isoform X2 [Lathamus discolor]|uniref:uncharacterized protein C15orf39 homolog isoform X2 n=1 Tax=Lathamus discolor TaxID=678569 RepID=UPI0032B84C7C
MASKRNAEPLDPMIFVKLPRLEQDPGASFPTGHCKPGSKNHFNYKGSYFACALQSPDGPKPPHVRQSPAPPHLHYGTGAGSQPVPVEGPGERCPPNPPESVGPRWHPPCSAEMGRDRLVPEPVLDREKWGSAGQGNPFLVKHPAMVNRAPALAVPRPMYRAPAYFMDLRVAQPLQQRPGNADWALPAASHPFHPGEHRRGPHADPSLPPLQPSTALPARERVGSPAAFSPYHAAFQQYRSPPRSPFLDDSPPSQRKVPEAHRLSPDPWHKLCPPSTSPVYQERPPERYPSLHKAPLLFPPPAPCMEAQPCAYRGFGFEGSREPYPGTYLRPQAPWRFFPSPSDTYVPRAASAVASPPPKPAALPRDAKPSRRAGCVLSSSFTFSPGGTAVPSTSRAHTEPGCEQHQPEGPRRPVVVRHSSAFQPIRTQEGPGGSGGIPEAFPKGGRCLGKQEPAKPERRASSAAQETPHEGPPALIAIEEGDTCKVKDLISPSPPASLPEWPEHPRASGVPPPSPPMPVINKVFSLASYGDFLEEAEGSDSFCREHLWEDAAPPAPGGSREPIAAAAAPVQRQGVQGQGESGRRGGPGEPEPVPQARDSEEEALDLRVKKRWVEAGESLWVLDGEGGKEEEKDAEREVGAGAQLQTEPLLVRVIPWDKSSFQSSASFMVLRSPSAAPSTVPTPSRAIPAPSSTMPALSSTIPAPSRAIPAPSSTIPAPSSTMPALSSTIPALSSTIPTLSSTIPAPSRAIPALSSTIPAPSRAIPTLSSTIPTLSSTIPALSSTIPAPSRAIPALSSTIPAPSRAIPTPSSTIPTLSSTIPALSSTIPAPSRAIPALSSTIPAPSSTIPALSSTIPAPTRAIPTPSSTMPALSSTIPAPSSAMPAPSSTIPAPSSTIPAPSRAIPATSSTMPALPSTIPAPSSAMPALSSTIPAPSSTIPAQSRAIPAPSSTIPATSSTIPALPSTMPALSSTIPAPSSAMPALSSTIPAPSSTIPAQSRAIPAPSSTIPAPSSTIPALPSTMPALSSTIPAPSSTMPALSSTIPAQSSTIPAPSSTMPALPSTIPAPSSTIPAPSSTMPALSSTMPALSSTIPTPSSTMPPPSSTIPTLSSSIPAPSSTIPALSSSIPSLSSTIPALSSIIPSPFRTTPAPSSTIPALFSTIPALSSIIPALSSTIPAPSSTIPALSSIIPSLSSTIPALSSIIPALSSTIHASSSTIPALSSTIPALPSTIPALSSIIPTLSSTIPALPSIIPALPSTIPVLSSTIPALSSLIPALSSTIPTLSSTIPALSSTIPPPSSTIPPPSSTIPSPSRTTPAPSSTIPPPPSTIPSPPSTIPAPPGTIPSPPCSPPRSPAPPPAPCSSSPPASPQPGPQPSPAALPEPPCAAPGEEAVPLPSAGRCFTALHTGLCDLLSCSVASSSPQRLREWLQKAEPAEEQGEAMPESPLEAKNGSRLPEHHKAAKGKEVWLAFQDVPALLASLLSQLETFMFARTCPFPHVVRAGAVFIPIHVVKEKLFPKLPGVSVDQVLQEHKVELRPTTLSEERHLRDLELKSCTSRMLKLLALKQLPDIYPDLLNLHWHNSIKQQLGSSSKAGKNPSK